MSDIAEREELEARRSIPENEDDGDNSTDESIFSGDDATSSQVRMKKVGTVERFFKKISVAAVSLTGSLSVGDTIEIRGSGSFRTRIESMQIEHEEVESALPGDSIGIKLDDEAKEGDEVYLVE
jgi:sulfate adenylyltransferase subunit 1 (EFTu-like GTPase family)